MDISIIIVNYNTKVLIKQCLGSIFDKTENIKFEIIIVDNASTDGSQQMLKNDFRGIKLIESNENLGFGKANNLGVKHARGKYLFFLNPDTILQNNAVKILADFLNQNPKVGICGGNLFNENGGENLSYSMFLPSILWELNLLSASFVERMMYGKNARFNQTNKPRKVGYITGADLMIRTELFNLYDGFDPGFFMYYEETELTNRIKKSGYLVYNVPQANIIHLEGQALGENWKKRVKLDLESRKKYYHKVKNKITIFLCNCIFFIGSLGKCITFKIINNKNKHQYWKYILKNMNTKDM